MGQTTPHKDRANGITPRDVLTFWVDDTGPKGWYATDDALDAEIRARFLPLWEASKEDGCIGWAPSPETALATIIVFDQFPRNMFRRDGRAFSSDAVARAKAKHALDLDWDLRIQGPSRQFFYLPLMHSECLADQERCVRLFMERMPEARDNLTHAKAHREVIRKFGRFPTRNGDLARVSTSAERGYLENGGYGAIVNAVRAAA
ncbi:DUF924 family protein [Meridianimarinicoccus aquatilis]|uniref:DUF924 domain-containing protein n=1 Tax=Meridianimarinicoccus aquatilis TaxID=2552766 RepID=A0A4V3BCI3_9RHOB|nr:DUF924 family protein [Fluviibacterium aquatile]QIE42095.1 DUF924 domain-containing protein [Rhodobacteraceae bacterium SC52]TDL90989.1 DUF924 domain-containing protein [Fluviibacterium aquatile]